MKYTNAPYTISEEEDIKTRNRKAVFIKETGTNKSILITMITTYGLPPEVMLTTSIARLQ